MLLSVTGFESTKTVQIRIYNVTTSTEVVAWTSTGVTERADGQGYSVYYYNYTLTAGSEYIVDWKDNSTPVNTASEGISALQSNVDAKVSLTALASVCTETRLAELDAANLITDVANVKTDTAEIGTAGAGLTNINLPNQTMDIVGNITGNLSGSVGSVTGHTAQTGDLYGLMTSADTELSAVPSTTGTIINKIKFLFQYFRNKKTVTGTTETLFKEDASTALGTSTLSDDGTTVTKGETS